MFELVLLIMYSFCCFFWIASSFLLPMTSFCNALVCCFFRILLRSSQLKAARADVNPNRVSNPVRVSDDNPQKK